MIRYSKIFIVLIGITFCMITADNSSTIASSQKEVAVKKDEKVDSAKREKEQASRERLLKSISKELSYLARNRAPFKHFKKEQYVCGALNSKGTFYALGSKKGSVLVGNAKTGAYQRTLEGHTKAVSWLAFSPEESKLLSCSMDTTAKIWDRSSGKELHTLVGHKGILFSGCFSADGKRVITGAADRTVRLWDVETGDLIMTVPLEFCVDAVSFCGGDKVCATSLNGLVKQWEDPEGKQISSVKGPKGPLIVSEFSTDGSHIFSSTYVGTLLAWDPHTGKTKRTIDLGDTTKAFSLASSAKATRLLAGCSDGTARLFDTTSGKELIRLIGSKESIHSVALSLEGRRALTVSYNGAAQLYDLSFAFLDRLKKEITFLQAAFIHEAYLAYTAKNPLYVGSGRGGSEMLVSFKEPLRSYLKEVFALQVDPVSERAALSAKK